MFAARYGHDECVKLLVEKEAGLSGRVKWSKQDQGSDNCTALMLAAAGGYPKCVELLVEKEAKM